MTPREDPKVKAKENSEEMLQDRLLDQNPKTQLNSSKGSFSKSLRPIALGKQQQKLLDQKPKTPKTQPHSYTAARTTLPKA